MPARHTFRSALVVANPIAGRGRGAAAARELGAGLQALGIETEVYLTVAAGDGARRLREVSQAQAMPELVVAVGGDGTIGEVLGALPGSTPLAVLPMGTANVLSVDLGIPRRVAGTLEMIQAGRSIALDTARVGERTCFLVTGVGFDGAIVERLAQIRRGPITKFTWARAIASSLWSWKPPRLRVWIDGERVAGEYPWVLISNAIAYGGLITLDRGRKLDDGLFEVFLFEKGSRLALGLQCLRGIVSSLPGGSSRRVLAAHVRVEADEAIPYEVDGDFGGTTPLELEVTGEHHQLLVP